MSRKSYEQNCRDGHSSPAHETSWTAAIEQRVRGTLRGATHDYCNNFGMNTRTRQRWAVPILDTTEEWTELTTMVAEDLNIDPEQILFERAHDPKYARKVLQYCLSEGLPVFVEIATRNPRGHTQTYGLVPIKGRRTQVDVVSNVLNFSMVRNLSIDYIAERMDYPDVHQTKTDSFNGANITVLPKGV